MKKILFTLIFIAAYAMGLAQEFKIPELTLEQKHNRTQYLANSNIIAGIAYAKTSGTGVDHFANYVGDLYKLTWNKENGFKGFVSGSLYNWENWRRASDPQMEILEQNANKVVFKSKNTLKELFENGPQFDVSYDELFKWYKMVHQRIGEYLGAGFEMEEMDGDWIKMTFIKME
jgi:hypothetical protein